MIIIIHSPIILINGAPHQLRSVEWNVVRFFYKNYKSEPQNVGYNPKIMQNIFDCSNNSSPRWVTNNKIQINRKLYCNPRYSFLRWACLLSKFLNYIYWQHHLRTFEKFGGMNVLDSNQRFHNYQAMWFCW